MASVYSLDRARYGHICDRGIALFVHCSALEIIARMIGL